MRALFLTYRLEKKQRDVKLFVRAYRGRSVGSGIDSRYPKISSDFLSLLGEAKFLHWWQQLTEEEHFFFFFEVTLGINTIHFQYFVFMQVLWQRDWNSVWRAIILAHWRGRNEIFHLISIAYSIFSLLWLHFCEANYEFPCLLLIYCYWNIIAQNAFHPGKSFSREWVIDGNKLPSLSVDHRTT